MHDLVSYVQSELSALADPAKARAMQAYMKTSMPFYGVQAPARRKVLKAAVQAFPAANRGEMEAQALALWSLPHREERYNAVELLGAYPEYIDASMLPLYERLMLEAAWWDIVDYIAIKLVGAALRKDPEALWPVLDQWIGHESLWLRRAALIAQNSRRGALDDARLYRYCLTRAHDKEFFIRKAIGWALREQSYAEPDTVRTFLLEHRGVLSGLSVREGARQLSRTGRWPQ